MMESQNRKRAPAWTEREVRDLIAVWGEESVLSELRSSFRNAKTFVKISQGMKDRGHNRDLKQYHVKLKELRQAYQKTREANGRSGSCLVEGNQELRIGTFQSLLSPPLTTCVYTIVTVAMYEQKKGSEIQNGQVTIILDGYLSTVQTICTF
ncbi:hypothetical protein UY3_08851 [Chelonia mydas]|uniref:Myb/SANT-like DNA-binding domain-containing protein n=1 Tax=Chelonia mydas TaxID=8469 RepID=M7BEI0_CHEMY|nr:hypothetical protein UY3_08851 [Chelonia mydas]